MAIAEAMMTLTREALYEAVWSKPLAHLATEYGTTTSSVVDACTRLEVPRPGRDHWGRTSRGETVPRIPLPPASKGTPSVLELRLRAPRSRPSASSIKGPLATKGEGSEAVEDHPLVASSRSALSGAKVNDHGMLVPPGNRRCLDVRVSPAQLERALQFTNRLLASLAAAGIRLEVKRAKEEQPFETWVSVDGESFQLHLEEKVNVKQREPTPEERRRRFLFGHELLKTYHPSGVLVLALGGLEGTGARQRWADTPASKLERKLDDVAPGLLAAAETVKARRIEAERVRRLREEEQQREAERRRALERQQALIAHVFQMRRRWVEANDLRRFADAAEAAVPGAQRDEVFEDWLDLVRWYADQMDPLVPPENAKELQTNPSRLAGWSDDDLGLGKLDRFLPGRSQW